MAIAREGANTGTTGTSTASSVTVTTGFAMNIGDTMIAAVFDSSGSIGSFSDSKGNTYNKITASNTAVSTGSSSNGNICVFYATLTAALTTTDTVKYTSGGTNKLIVSIVGYSGILSSGNPVDITVTQSQVNPSLASGTPSQANELLFAVGMEDGATSTISYNGATNWTTTSTARAGAATASPLFFFDMGVGEIIETTAAGKTFTPTWSVSYTNGAAVIVSFKATATASSATVAQTLFAPSQALANAESMPASIAMTLGGNSAMTIRFDGNNGSSAFGNSTQFVLGGSFALGVGNYMVVSVFDSGALNHSGVTDTQGNTYTYLTSVHPNGDATKGELGVFYSKITTGLSATDSVKYTSGASGALCLDFTGYHNISSSSPVDITVSATATSSIGSLASGAPATVGEVLIGSAAFVDSASSSQSYSGASGWTLRGSSRVNDSGNGWFSVLGVSDFMEGTAGQSSQNFAPTAAQTYAYSAAIVVSFKPQTGGGGGVSQALTIGAQAVQSIPVTIAQTLAGFSQSVAVIESIPTQIAQVLFAPTQAAHVQEIFVGSIRQTLPGFSQVLTGSESFPTRIAQTLDGLLQSLDASSEFIRIAQTLDGLLQSLDASSEFIRIAQTLAGFTQQLAATSEITEITTTLPGLFQRAIIVVTEQIQPEPAERMGGGGIPPRPDDWAMSPAELEFFRSPMYARGIDALVPSYPAAKYNLTTQFSPRLRPVTQPIPQGKPDK